jgi:hypothetical protein
VPAPDRFFTEQFSDEPHPFLERHRAPVDAWLDELDAKDDPGFESAEHAVYCLLSSFHFADHGEYDWAAFEVPSFLFGDLHESGTVAMFGSVALFFDHLVEALRRFAAAELMAPTTAARILTAMEDCRAAFVRYYDEATSNDEAMAIADRCASRWAATAA